MFHKLLFILFIFLSLQSFSQMKNCDERYSQSFSICNDTINLKVSSNKNIILSSDTLKIKFTVKNVSKNEIAVFEKPKLNYMFSKDSLDYRIIIDYMISYAPDFEVNEVLKKINSQDTLTFNYSLVMYNELLNEATNIQVGFGISYIPDVSELKYNNLNQGFIEVNSSEVLKFIQSINSKALNIKYVK